MVTEVFLGNYQTLSKTGHPTTAAGLSLNAQSYRLPARCLKRASGAVNMCERNSQQEKVSQQKYVMAPQAQQQLTTESARELETAHGAQHLCTQQRWLRYWNSEFGCGD